MTDNETKGTFPDSPSPLPTRDENPNGLHRRYIISKANGEPVDPKAEYFVLRLDDGGKDLMHVAACRSAVREYARQIATHLPKLSDDLRKRYEPEKVNPLEATAQKAYEAYCATRDWKSVRGEALPQWQSVEDGIKAGWRAAAEAAVTMFFSSATT